MATDRHLVITINEKTVEFRAPEHMGHDPARRDVDKEIRVRAIKKWIPHDSYEIIWNTPKIEGIF